MASVSGGVLDHGMIELDVLDGNAVVDLKNKTFASDLPESGLLLEIVVLHYLKGCLDEGAKEEVEWSPFRQLKGGEAFHVAFQKRVVDSIAERFSSRPDDLISSGTKLKGKAERFGSATVVLRFLPHLHVRITVWQGDDEVPGNAAMLFSPGAGSLLPTEDFAEVGSVVLSALVRSSTVR